MKETTVEKGAIPADYDFNDTLAIVLNKIRAYKKIVKKKVKKHFNGNYVFVEESDLMKMKDRYRYWFNYTVVKTITKQRLSTGLDNAPSYYDMNIIRYSITDDKKGGTIYSQKTEAFWVADLVEAYMINLEKLRLSKK